MEEIRSGRSNNGSGSLNNGFSFVPNGPVFYNYIRSGHISRLAQNLTRSNEPFALGAAHEGSRIIRNNINSVINELEPLMESARPREGTGLNLRLWLRRQNQSDENLVSTDGPAGFESTIIDFGNNINNERISAAHQEINVFQPGTNNAQQYLCNNASSQNATENSIHENFINEEHEHYNQNQNINNSVGNNGNSVSISVGPEVESSQNEATIPDTQTIVSFFHMYIPFIIILFGKAIYDHRAGVLIFLALLVTFTHADSVVKREIAKQSHRSLMSLFILFLNLFFCICFIYYVFYDQHLYKSLILIPPYTQPLNFWDLLWIVGITDFVLKFITILIKAGIACFPARLLPYTARGKWYLFLECISQLYRGLVPIQPWLYYLLESYQGPEKIIGVFLSAVYMFSKRTDLLSKIKLFKKAFLRLLQNVSLGVSPSKEQLDIAGAQCPICHDDYETPVLLHCRHVFCEACVTTWFDREQTCPVCRTKVADDPTWKDGATTFFLQLF